MAKFDIPKKPIRKYGSGVRDVISLRLPQSLLKRIAKEVKDKGYTQTELIELVLDQYFQSVDSK